MDEYIKKEDIEQKIQDGLNNLVLGHDAIEVLGMIYEMPTADVAPVRHGRWILEVHDERVNYRWNVTAECSECCNEKKEIWAGFFAYIVPSIARSVSLTSAKRVKLSNYCPNCGAKMDGGADD